MDTSTLHNRDLPYQTDAHGAEPSQAIYGLILKTISLLGLRGGFPGLHGQEQNQDGEQGGIWAMDVRGA